MNKVRKIEFEGNYHLFNRLKQFTIIVTRELSVLMFAE